MSVQIGEGSFPLREHISERGNLTYVVAPRDWTTNRGFRGFPMDIKTLGLSHLPSSCIFAGHTLALERGETKNGNPKVSCRETIDIRGEQFTAEVLMSITKSGDCWLIIKALPGSRNESNRKFNLSDF